MAQKGQYTYDYPRAMLTADCVLVDSADRVLLVRRGGAPYKGCWALPGGFMEMDEPLERTAQRELAEETGIGVEADELRLVGVFSRVDRDPRGRTITAAYSARVPEGTTPTAGDDAAAVGWWPLADLPPLAFDHADILDAYIAQRQAQEKNYRDSIRF